MTQAQLDRHVARSTGESPRTVRRLGFSALHDGPAESHPGALYLVVDCPRCGGRAPYPDRLAGGPQPPAECPGCEAPFGFDLLDVYVATSLRA